jgi:hypothetical protein
MHIPKTYLSLHDVTGLQVRVGRSAGKPLELVIDGDHGCMQVTLFLQPLLTAEQVEALAEAAQAIIRAPAPAVPPDPCEAAAYMAADDYWSRLTADLDRRPIERETLR